MNKPIRVYQCEDTAEGIFTAAYDAGKSGYGHKYIRLQAQSEGLNENYDLFSEYIRVNTEIEKAEKVARSVRTGISETAYENIMKAVCSESIDKADVIYHYMVYGFSMGAKVTNALQIPCVQRMFEINRAVMNESHFFLEFLRFKEIQKEPPLLLAVFEPKSKVLPLVTEHFADRFNPEWFIIYDKLHREAAFHNPNGEWYVRKLNPDEEKRLQEMDRQEERYTDLWQVFFNTIAISERANPKLQRSNLPLWYRKHMPEFSDKGKPPGGGSE